RIAVRPASWPALPPFFHGKQGFGLGAQAPAIAAVIPRVGQKILRAGHYGCPSPYPGVSGGGASGRRASSGGRGRTSGGGGGKSKGFVVQAHPANRQASAMAGSIF